MKKRFLVLIPLFFLFIIINPVHAESEVNLLNIPEQLGIRLGVGTFAGGILASVILLMICVLPIALISRKRGTGSIMAELIVGLAVLGGCVAMAWFPVWIFILLILLISLFFSNKITGLFGGKT